MTPDQFVRRRSSEWEELERLLKKTQRSAAIRQLTEQELRALGRLYRAATADLALAQRDFPNHDVTTFLNSLVGRAHPLVYRGARIERSRFRHFVRAGFPQLFRRTWRYTALAALLLFVPWAIGWWLVARDPQLAHLLVPEIGQYASYLEQGELWTEIPPEERAGAGAFIMQNNIRISFNAFAGGLTAGLFTIFILLINGITFGGIFGFVQAHGMISGLMEFVIGHGPIELTEICIAGGAGLRVGHAMVVPGLMRRRDAVVQAAREAFALAFGGALLLIIAALIEGFISPSALPWQVKTMVGLGSGILLFVYLLTAGRAEEARERDRQTTDGHQGAIEHWL